MPTPSAVEPPAPENVHLDRAAALAWRSAWREAIGRHEDRKFANPHVPLHAAALAVKALVPEMMLYEARTFAQPAVAWTAQAHHGWFWRGTHAE